MFLVTGGAYNGKKDWSAAHWKIADEDFLDGAVCGADDPGVSGTDYSACGIRALDNFHLLVKRWIVAGLDPDAMTDSLINAGPDLIIITDEIGSGIVPADKSERDYREIHGRICCRLAKEAQEVWRVFCGIGQRIK